MQLHRLMKPRAFAVTHRFVFATAVLAAATPALACECIDPATQSNADRQQQAKWIASTGASIALVELVHSEQGERYRTVRHLWGQPQASYPVRDPFGPVTSCDYGITSGKRAIMVFLPQATRTKSTQMTPCRRLPQSNGREFIPAGMCTQLFVQAPGNVERVRRSASP